MTVAALLVCLAAGLTYIALAPRQYSATAEIFVAASVTDNAQALAQGNTFVQARVQSYTNVATSPAVTDPVVRKLGLAMTAAQLGDEISAVAPINKVVVDLTVVDRSATQAARLANAVADQFTSVVQTLEQTSADASSPVKLTVIHPAGTPTAPYSPKAALIVPLAVVAGLILGILLSVIRALLDNTVKTATELERAAASPVLATTPWDKNTANAPVAFRTDPHGRRAEAFRTLRTNLQFIDVDNPPRVLAITSSHPSEGKTHTAINLAAALAEVNSRVCLIEADLRRPTVASLLGLVGSVGMTDVLTGATGFEDVVQSVGRNLAVLTAGGNPPNPTELLSSRATEKLIREIADQVDYVIIDTPPLLAVTDGAIMAALADATLLAVRAGKTSLESVHRSIDQLGKVGVKPVGAVLSMVARGQSSQQGAYDYYYGRTGAKETTASSMAASS